MPGYDVIEAVSTTLKDQLDEAFTVLDPQDPPTAEISDLLGNVQTTPPKLTVFFFEVIEDPSQRNRPRVRGNVPPDISIKKPPVALLLRYLMTPWADNRLTEQKLLGRTIQVLYDGAIISGTDLKGSLANTDQALKLTMAPLTLEERTRIWHAIQKPYRTSLTYEVRVVNLEPEKEQLVKPVSSRTLDHGEVEAV